jgi:cytochrome c-type biogenesis protein CcmE
MEETLSAPKVQPMMRKQNRLKFFVGGGLIIAAIIYLIVSSTHTSAQYFLTVDELKAKSPASLGNRELRISGAVMGDSIQYDSNTLTLTFTVAHVPGDNAEIDKQGGLAAVLHAAVLDPKRNHLQVVYKGAKPDLLKNEAQAIMTGKMGSDGAFHATELLLKCPTKYEEAVPSQAK